MGRFAGMKPAFMEYLVLVRFGPRRATHRKQKSGGKMAHRARTKVAIAEEQGQFASARFALRLILLAFPLFVLSWAQVFAQPMQLSPRSLDGAPLADQEVVQPAMPVAQPKMHSAPVDVPIAVISAEPAMTQAAHHMPAQPPVAPAAIAPRERYNVVVLGDSLGDGLWAGLYHVLRKDKRFNVIKKSRVATGFSRHDYFDWNAAVRDIAGETRIDIAVVVMGTNDRQPIMQDGVRHALFDAGWRDIYERRVNDFTATLKGTGAAIYWIELPVMRSPRFGGDMERFNEIFEARARANAVAYVSMDGVATGADGGYTAYGPDRSGSTKLLRADDGIHFTMAGYELLGERVANALLADIEGGGAPVALVSTEPVMLRESASDAELEKASAYDMADRRPGRSDDWLWLGATN